MNAYKEERGGDVDVEDELHICSLYIWQIAVGILRGYR